jgi:hypothetical protein
VKISRLFAEAAGSGEKLDALGVAYQLVEILRLINVEVAAVDQVAECLDAGWEGFEHYLLLKLNDNFKAICISIINKVNNILCRRRLPILSGKAPGSLHCSRVPTSRLCFDDHPRSLADDPE